MAEGLGSGDGAVLGQDSLCHVRVLGSLVLVRSFAVCKI